MPRAHRNPSHPSSRLQPTTGQHHPEPSPGTRKRAIVHGGRRSAHWQKSVPGCHHSPKLSLKKGYDEGKLKGRPMMLGGRECPRPVSGLEPGDEGYGDLGG